MTQEEVKVRIKTGFRDLLQTEPSSISELDEWSARADSLKLLMRADLGDLKVPHSLWHYLDDADIRLKDDRYAEVQIAHIITVMDEW